MSFVVAGISWIGSKSTRNKGKRTKGATALHWGRGEAPLGECWVPAPINQMQGCMPVIHLVLKGKWKCHPGLFPIFVCLPDTLANTGNSVWASSGLIVYQNHALNLSPSHKPCLLGSVVCPPCSHSHLSTARASLPTHDHSLLRISSPLKLKLTRLFVLTVVLLTSASCSSIQMDSSPWCLMKWSKRGTPNVIDFFSAIWCQSTTTRQANWFSLNLSAH